MATTVHDEDEAVSLRFSLLLEQPANRSKLAAAQITYAWKHGKPAEGMSLFQQAQPQTLNPRKKLLENAFSLWSDQDILRLVLSQC